MKNLSYLLLLIIFTGCTHYSKKEKDPTKITAITKKDTIFPGDKDTLTLDSDGRFKFLKGTLRKIAKENPELNSADYIEKPDIAYSSSHNFGSEAGQDEYFVLYAYFLKSKNGEKKYQQQRQTLIKIYRGINSIYGRLARGGTYFGHQYSRILGYAEYSIYAAKDNDYYIKKYSISKQKALYLNTLRQIITDELSADFDFLEDEKPALKKELLKTVNELNNLITDYFYLNMAREFQYSNY